MELRARRSIFQVAIGVLVMLMPVLGFPLAWETIAQYILGALIVFLALPFSIVGTCRAMFSRPGTCDPTFNSSSDTYHNAGEKNRT